MAGASVAQAPHAEVVALGNLGTRQGARDQRSRWLHSTSPPLVFVYAAGPCGSWLYRDLTKQGQVCWAVWPTPAPQRVCQADVRAITAHPARLARLAQARTDPGPPGRLAPVVDARQARRGVPGTVAVPPVAARGALPRCEPPRQRRPSLGFTPSADATGERRRPGGLTKPGPRQARRALGEGAWASRSPANISRPLP